MINHNNAFGANDFNYRYLQEYLDCYDVCNPPLGAPYIEFVLTVGLEEDSNDRISNLIPFMLVEDIEDSELDICIRYEVEDFIYFQLEMKELFSEGKDENAFSKFLNLLHNTDYVLKYYDKNMSKIDVDFKLSNLMELQCIKANHLKMIIALRMHLIRLSTTGMTIFSKKKKGSDKGTRENQSRFD